MKELLYNMPQFQVITIINGLNAWKSLLHSLALCFSARYFCCKKVGRKEKERKNIFCITHNMWTERDHDEIASGSTGMENMCAAARMFYLKVIEFQKKVVLAFPPSFGNVFLQLKIKTEHTHNHVTMQKKIFLQHTASRPP